MNILSVPLYVSRCVGCTGVLQFRRWWSASLMMRRRYVTTDWHIVMQYEENKKKEPRLILSTRGRVSVTWNGSLGPHLKRNKIMSFTYYCWLKKILTCILILVFSISCLQNYNKQLSRHYSSCLIKDCKWWYIRSNVIHYKTEHHDILSKVQTKGNFGHKTKTH